MIQVAQASDHSTDRRDRPASGSALLAGQIVAVTVPSLQIGNSLLAIGSEWTEQPVPEKRKRSPERRNT